MRTFHVFVVTCTLGVGLMAAEIASKSMDELPAAARAALEQRAAGNTVEGVKTERSDGELVYEGRWHAAGHLHEAVVTSRGDVIETEDAVETSEVPASVRATASARLSGTLAFVRKTVVFYEAVQFDDEGDEQAELLLRPTGGVVDESALEGGDDEHADRDGERAERDGDGDEHEGDDDEDDDGEELAVALRDVPAVVLAAAKAALPGATFTSASSETEHGATIWELAGSVDGDDVEIEVSAAGKVLEIERD